MIIDGKKIAEEIITQLAAERAELQKVIRVGVLLSEGDAASASFVRIKERVAERLRVELVREQISLDTTTEAALHIVRDSFSDLQGVIVQLPLPPQIATEQVLAAISLRQDIDALNPTIRDLDRPVRPPVAEALAEILTRANVSLRGQTAVVVGAGRLVGQPCAALLRQMGASVSVITQEHGSLDELKTADVVVLGAGNPGFVTPAMLKEGVILFDAGTSLPAARLGEAKTASESNSRVVGDADPDCASVASLFTPVPGGVGPIAIAMLFKNLFALVKK